MSFNRIWKRLVGASFFYWLLPASVLAADFAMTVSNNDEFCNYMLANLRALSSDTDLTCRMHIARGFERLSEPVWEELDPLENLQLYRDDYARGPGANLKLSWYRKGGYLAALRTLLPNFETMEEIVASGVPYPSFDEMWDYVGDGIISAKWENRPRQILLDRIATGTVRLRATQVIVGDSGFADTIYDFKLKNCRTSLGLSDPNGPLADDEIVDRHGNRLRLDWGSRVRRYSEPNSKFAQPQVGLSISNMYYVYFEDQFYGIHWNAPPHLVADPILKVFHSSSMFSICEFTVQNYGL